jgi:hypothetical protein
MLGFRRSPECGHKKLFGLYGALQGAQTDEQVQQSRDIAPRVLTEPIAVRVFPQELDLPSG